MKGRVSINVNSLVEMDPVNIKDRHPNSNYEFFYKICISIPIMISFSLVFFMIFYISPRGQSMQLFQKGIYDWNKDRLADHMNSLNFKYFIQPFYDSKLNAIDGFNMQHTDLDELVLDEKSQNRGTNSGQDSEIQADFQDTIRQIYYYQQSYFRVDSVASGIFAPTIWQGRPQDSDSYCIETFWKSKDDSVIASFQDTDEQPICSNSNSIEGDVGLSFELYKWMPNQEFTCRLSSTACQLNCNLIMGYYNDDDGQCYEMHQLSKLCVKVDLTYVDNLPPSEADLVSSVKVTKGCFVDGAVGLYKIVTLDQLPDGMYKQTFDDVSVEVRHDRDPYTVFTSIDYTLETTDLSIFFWMSMMCLILAVFLIVWLGLYYHCYISNE